MQMRNWKFCGSARPILLMPLSIVIFGCGHTEVITKTEIVKVPVIEPMPVDRRCTSTIEPETPAEGVTYGEIVVHHGRDQAAMRRLNANIRCLSKAVKVPE